MTVVWRPCSCVEGRASDGRECTWCDGRGGWDRPLPPAVTLVCGHPARSVLRGVKAVGCTACGFDVEVVDPARLDDQRARFADAIEERASELEVAPLWGWPEPPRSERARLDEERVEALIRMRRVAGAMRAQVGTRRAA